MRIAFEEQAGALAQRHRWKTALRLGKARLAALAVIAIIVIAAFASRSLAAAPPL